MLYHDAIYGEMEINEPVILELLKSPTMQRLKGVDKAGYRPLWVKPQISKDSSQMSRFDHSVGVYLLLKKYSAPLEEQIAGLIHDVSHTAFSHCIDYVLAEGSQKNHDYQDNAFDSYVRRSDIPRILTKHGFDLERVLNDANFPLKENKLPDICADRIDYSLRDAKFYDEATAEDIAYLLNELSATDGRWVFKSFESAKKFAELFYKMNQIYYASFSGVVMHQAVGDYVKLALDKNYISFEDLYTTDREVLDKIAVHLPQDEKSRHLFERLEGRVRGVEDLQNFEIKSFCKSRAVDPLFERDGKVIRVSDVDPVWGETVGKENQPKEYFLRFEN